MKKILSSLVALAFATAAFSQSFHVNGIIHGLPDGSVLELVPAATHQDEKPIASATVNQGKFKLSGTIDAPQYFFLSVKDTYGGCSILLDKADNAVIEATAKLTEQPDNKFYNFENKKITGAPLNDLYEVKMAPRQELDKQHGAIQEKFAAISQKMSSARTAKDSLLAAQIEQSDEWQAYEKAEGDFFKNAESVIGKIIADNKESWWGPLLTLNLYNFFPPQNEHLYDDLSEQAKSSYYGQILKEQVRPEGFLNKSAPVISAETETGQKLDLPQVLSKNKVVLIDFWASWCAPCRKKIPELKALYETYKGQGLEIVGISIDKKGSDWTKALREEQLPYPNYIDGGETANNWKVRAIPALFLVDSTGKIIAENIALSDVAKYLN